MKQRREEGANDLRRSGAKRSLSGAKPSTQQHGCVTLASHFSFPASSLDEGTMAAWR